MVILMVLLIILYIGNRLHTDEMEEEADITKSWIWIKDFLGAEYF